MNNIKKIKYLFLIFLYEKVLKKDSMKLKIQKYRDYGVKIGEDTRAFSPLMSAEPYLLEFGDRVTISTGVKFTTHDNSVSKIIENSTDLFGKIKIGDDCFIGQNSIILPGVTLGNNIIVGAGSVVTKSFTDEGIIIGGNPAKVIGNREAYRKKYEKYAFSTKGYSFEQKKELILKNINKLIEK